jgi:adenosine deaminase
MGLQMTNSNTSSSFIEALQNRNVVLLSTFPKADRHCHSLFGASLDSIRTWSGNHIHNPPLRMADFDEMRKYAHEELYATIHNKVGHQFTAEQAIIEAIQDGVTILEMSLDVINTQYFKTGTEGFISFIKSLSSKYRERIDFRPELGISKNRDPSTQIPLATECVESAVFRSIDLYGNEDAQEPESYISLYQHARKNGMKLKAHVGEFCGPDHIKKTLRVLDLDEIQHGVLAAKSKPLMNHLRQEHIRLNVCPSSNVALSVSKDMAHHPIRSLVDNGVRVSINTDDKTIFGKTVTDEYLGLFQAGTLDAGELDRIRLDSLKD